MVASTGFFRDRDRGRAVLRPAVERPGQHHRVGMPVCGTDDDRVLVPERNAVGGLERDGPAAERAGLAVAADLDVVGIGIRQEAARPGDQLGHPFGGQQLVRPRVADAAGDGDRGLGDRHVHPVAGAQQRVEVVPADLEEAGQVDTL